MYTRSEGWDRVGIARFPYIRRQKEVSGGGMAYGIIKICTQITWLFIIGLYDH